MKSRIGSRSTLVALVLSLAMLPGLGAAQPREYAIPEIRVRAEILPDASVRVTEERVYVFEGSWSWADYRLPLEGFTRIRDIRVAEGQRAFLNENGGRPGTFEVARGDGAVAVRWFYEAEDESRRFTLSYVLDGAVVIGPRWSEFFWSFVGARREKPTASLFAEVRLPEEVDVADMQAWGRGALEPLGITRTPGSFGVEAEDVGRREFVALRAVFPSAVFASSVEPTDQGFSLEQVLREESVYLRERSLAAERAAFAARLAPLLMLANILVFLYYYFSHGRRLGDAATGTRPPPLSPPEPTYRPAAIGWLLGGRSLSGRHVMASLLDLGRKGYLLFREVPRQGLGLGKRTRFLVEVTGKTPDDDLLDWERDLLAFVRRELADSAMPLDKLLNSNSRSLHHWFRNWKRQVGRYCHALGWVDLASHRAAIRHAVAQGALLTAAVALVVLGGPRVGETLPAVFVAGIALLLSFALVRRTREGERVYRRWRDYRRALRDGRLRMEPGRLDSHLVYATALGVRRRDIERLFQVEPLHVAAMPWLHAQGGVHSPAALAASVTALSATGASAFGGVAGGGGASAGSAGGGASGGAG